MPTFMIFKNGRETQRIRGADAKALDAAVKSLASEASSSDASSSGAGGSSGGMWLGASLPRGYEDVTTSVDVRGLDFLNVEGDAKDQRALFEPTQPSGLSKGASDDKDWIESETDEQLMLFMPFQSTLKVHSLHITSCPPANDEDISRPKSIHLYINRSNVLGFDEADGITPTQAITLDESSWDAKTATAKIELRFVKFQNVTSLVVYVVDSEGGEKTRVDRIRIVGETGETRKMGKLEKIGDQQGE